jgi:outer membrane protein assembly factor BamE
LSRYNGLIITLVSKPRRIFLRLDCLQMLVFSSASSPRFSSLAAALIVISSSLLLPGCGSFGNASSRVAGLVTPYKVEVVQGNFVSKEQKDALQIGMPRGQVRDILGSPLVTSAFHADRWEYVFTIRRQGAEPQQRKVTVLFKGDELAKVEADELISEEEFVGTLSQGRSLGKAPKLEANAQELPKPPERTSAPTAETTAPAGSAPRSYPPLESPTR